jgi:hypothetical protein
MQEYIVTVHDRSKSKAVIDLLKTLDYLQIRERKQKVERKKNGKQPSPELRRLFGIWKGRDITLEEIRRKAWGRDKK